LTTQLVVVPEHCAEVVVSATVAEPWLEGLTAIVNCDGETKVAASVSLPVAVNTQRLAGELLCVEQVPLLQLAKW
jgi:hypothetical protein